MLPPPLPLNTLTRDPAGLPLPLPLPKYIPMEAKKFRDAAISRSRGLEVTIQCDGWSGINFHHYLAFMITTSSREVSNSDL